jgi:hypothetical protein
MRQTSIFSEIISSQIAANATSEMTNKQEHLTPPKIQKRQQILP